MSYKLDPKLHRRKGETQSAHIKRMFEFGTKQKLSLDEMCVILAYSYIREFNIPCTEENVKKHAAEFRDVAIARNFH